MKKEIIPVNILLVDDNEDDIYLITRILKKLKVLNELFIVQSGEDAIDFIYHKGKYAESKPPLPGLILLDISMPGLSGFDVLERLKGAPVFKPIPVVMLTTSSREEDILKSYLNGACSYITKPIDFEDLIRVVEHFELYWTLVSEIPKIRR